MMICHICATHYNGDLCPKCGTVKKDGATASPAVVSTATESTHHAVNTNEVVVCPRCGSFVENNLCVSCGFALQKPSTWMQDNATASTYNTTIPAGSTPPPPPKSNRKLVVALMVSLVLVVGLSSVLIFGMLPLNAQPENSTTTLFNGSQNENSAPRSESAPESSGLEQSDSESNSEEDEETQNQAALSYAKISGVSKEEFAQLKVGMSYGEISGIIGADGQISILDDAQFAAVWNGEEDPSSWLKVEFQDQRATRIDQDGMIEPDGADESEAS